MGGDKLFKMHNGYKWYTEELYLCKTCFNEKYAEKKGLVKTLTGTQALVTGGCLGYFTAHRIKYRNSIIIMELPNRSRFTCRNNKMLLILVYNDRFNCKICIEE